MAKTYRVVQQVDIGGDTVTTFHVGDSFPASHEHLAHFVKEGYVVEGKADPDQSVDPATGLPPADSKVYEENEGSVADAQGTEIDVVGHGQPKAEDVQAATPKERAKKSSAKRKTTRSKPRT